MRALVGVLVCCVALVVAREPLSAQNGGGDVKAALKSGFDEVNGWITQAVERVPAAQWNYRPVETVRTFGQLVTHVADGYAYFCAKATDPNVRWSDAIEKGTTDRAAAIAALQRAAASCTRAHDAANANAGNLMANIAHANLHYGNMVTYMRMLGLVPPSS